MQGLRCALFTAWHQPCSLGKTQGVSHTPFPPPRVGLLFLSPPSQSHFFVDSDSSITSARTPPDRLRWVPTPRACTNQRAHPPLQSARCLCLWPCLFPQPAPNCQRRDLKFRDRIPPLGCSYVSSMRCTMGGIVDRTHPAPTLWV